jgi:sugar-specific transcriptional regulator TrmB
MVSLEEDAKVLGDFGFTYNQAKIYTAITRMREASVGSISRMAKVRREHVYRTLPKLEKMGLVERILVTPERIKCIPVEDALSVLIKRQKDEAEKKISALATQARTFLDHYEQREFANVPEQESQFSLISEKDGIMTKTASIMNKARKEIIVAASRRKLAKLMFFYSDLLKKSMKRGVKVQLLTEMPEQGDALPRFIEEHIAPGTSLELRYSPHLETHYIIVDNKEVAIGISTEMDFTECPMLWTNSIALTTLTLSNFTSVWNASANWTAPNNAAASSKVVVLRSNSKS